ncbi:uncharacterized protein ACHE_80157A [Aspergillus chevalieri]|uniref:Uncharacterized protein n=1 Tax=Aspergillus chevalieri TaxID=182096 RepID=A0A7R7VWV3_ASPCH|nr:uncharacterized protein ACHE_80157A [Aspergillus chevalieri]BCR92257.1 hypothetical protein ACHE_80157A [Aspergillus chevalieri]
MPVVTIIEGLKDLLKEPNGCEDDPDPFDIYPDDKILQYILKPIATHWIQTMLTFAFTVFAILGRCIVTDYDCVCEIQLHFFFLPSVVFWVFLGVYLFYLAYKLNKL